MPNESPKISVRPTSPHLSIYRWQISSVLSILHRMTGMALYVGMALIVVWLWSAAYDPAFYGTLHTLLVSPVGLFCLLGWTFAFYYHLGNGIRHLFWDIGLGFTLPVMNKTGWAVVIAAFLLTAFTWGVAFSGGQ